MEDSYLQLRVVYKDPPDLIELGISVRSGQWSAYSKAYVGPWSFADDGRKLLDWVSSPEGSISIDTGVYRRIGWMGLKFYTVDRAGHVCCAVALATGEQADRPESSWRFAIELPTELGLVEKFARECIALGSDLSQEAQLETR